MRHSPERGRRHQAGVQNMQYERPAWRDATARGNVTTGRYNMGQAEGVRGAVSVNRPNHPPSPMFAS